MSKTLFNTILAALIVLAATTGCTRPGPAASPGTAPALQPAAARPASTTDPFPGLKEWDLLIISDSSNWGVGAAYAKLIEADRGVRVRLHDCWLAGMPITEALAMLQETSSALCEGKWTDLFRDAEVIVLFGNPTQSLPAGGAWSGPETWLACVHQTYADNSAAYKANMAKSCAAETFATYQRDLGAVFDKIFALRAGRPVILRAPDSYVPIMAQWDKAGFKDVCGACYDNFVQAIHQTAAEHGVPVASTMDAFNGPDHRSDPTQKGYISGDGEHPSDAGAQRLAEALQQTGYAYAGK